MCGIAGYIGPEQRPYDDAACLRGMSDELRHRGPDDAGLWFDAARGVGLAHRRLAVIDLSAEGHQPMASASGRYRIVFNGEIYNFRELRGELERLGHSFRGHSDTEVMLAALEQWGVEASLVRFQGMFAFALWDRQLETLFLARDRAGEKPLYYGWSEGTFLFGSELKALRRHPAWTGGVDPLALNLLLRYTYIPAPFSIHPGIRKLPPASYLTLKPGRSLGGESVTSYWSVLEAARGAEPFQGGDQEAIDALEGALSSAISRQIVSDVPLGAFLSGGVDSSTVVALMQAQSSIPVKTFTIGFHEQGYDEARWAREVARHLGTDHTELYVTEREALEVIPLLPRLYDEPFADSSQIPTFLLSRLAREKVTVSLSGDGGDELFCGYNRYSLVEQGWGKVSGIPAPLRRQAETISGVLAPLLGLLGKALPGCARSLDGDRLQRLARLFGAATPHQLNELMTCYDSWADRVTGVSPDRLGTGRNAALWESFPSLPGHMMLLDFMRYLPDDILVKVDRAAMGVSLETRIPFLDPALVELAWRLPERFKRRDGESKWILRQLLYTHVPRSLIDRPKMGFGLPVGNWLRGPLRDWGETLLGEVPLSRSGLLDPAPVRRKWREHLAGKRNWSFELWPVLMFQAWFLEESR